MKLFITRLFSNIYLIFTVISLPGTFLKQYRASDFCTSLSNHTHTKVNLAYEFNISFIFDSFCAIVATRNKAIPAHNNILPERRPESYEKMEQS
jgi:hypothetical protein